MTARGALLLRAVNVGGRNRVPMAELRSLLSGRLGLENVSTYIASGNILCDLPADRPGLPAEVRALIAEEFSVDTPVILRTRDELAAALTANPFPDVAEERMLHAMFLAGPADGGAIDALTPRLQPGERIALVGADLWIDYGTGGVQSTKLTTGVLDRALGVSGTARNLRTVRTLAELTADAGR